MNTTAGAPAVSMNDIDSLCDKCAVGGVECVLDVLDLREQIEALAVACSARAKLAESHGNPESAQRLMTAVHYLNYLSMPYD
jgi:hypothetical protein